MGLWVFFIKIISWHKKNICWGFPNLSNQYFIRFQSLPYINNIRSILLWQETNWDILQLVWGYFMWYKIWYRALSVCYTYVYLSCRLIGHIDHQNSCVIVSDARVTHMWFTVWFTSILVNSKPWFAMIQLCIFMLITDKKLDLLVRTKQW